jgi:cyanophycinase-like exopeptidase
MPDRAAAEDPFGAATIREAEAVFIAGGDQANYINFWMGAHVQQALNDAISRNIPVGGMSAGIAVQGEFVYSAQRVPDGPLSSRLFFAHLHCPARQGRMNDAGLHRQRVSMSLP